VEDTGLEVGEPVHLAATRLPEQRSRTSDGAARILAGCHHDLVPLGQNASIRGIMGLT
jgi:hypothetical protein